MRKLMYYSVLPTDQIFVKAYGYLSFTTNMGKNIGKNISKILSGEYSRKLLNHAKQSATDAVKATSKKVIQKTADATGDFIDDKIANRITKVSKSSQQNNSETVTNTKHLFFFIEEAKEGFKFFTMNCKSIIILSFALI